MREVTPLILSFSPWEKGLSNEYVATLNFSTAVKISHQLFQKPPYIATAFSAWRIISSVSNPGEDTARTIREASFGL